MRGLNIFSNRIFSTIDAEISQYENRGKILSFDDYIKKTFNKTANLFLAGVEALFFLDDANQVKSDILKCVEKSADLPGQSV